VRKRILFNVSHMNCVVHQSPGFMGSSGRPNDEIHRPRHLGAIGQAFGTWVFRCAFLADVIGIYDVYRDSRDAALTQEILLLNLSGSYGGSSSYWRQAAAIASTASLATAKIGVVPISAVDVVRYHPSPRAPLLRGWPQIPMRRPGILIVSPGSISPPFMSTLKACYPLVLGRAERVEVRSG
jgi:hypothetical protein